MTTIKDIWGHMLYRCGIEHGNPFINRNMEGGGGPLNRKTMYAFQIQKEDMFTFKGNVLYDKIRKRRKRLIRNYEMGDMGGVESLDM